MSLLLKVRRLRPGAPLPSRAGDLEAGLDFYSPHLFKLPPRFVFHVPLGIALEIPDGYFLLLRDRSSMASSGLLVCGGVIDCTYRGEVSAMFLNTTDREHEFRAGQKIVQGLLLPVPRVSILEVEELSETERGSGGFGSTGV